MGNSNIGFQFFADAGTLVNATGNYVNAYTGTTTAFDTTNKLTPTMKTFYDTQLLENARPELIFAQLAKKQALPRNHGKSVEWRKWNTLPEAETLTEGVIPTGQKLGMSSMTQDIVQKGLYVTISDQLELHAIDNAILGATEELGASGGMSVDKMVRNEVVGGTVKQLCDKVNATTGVHTEVTTRSGMDTTSVLTPTEINKAVTTLKKMHAPTINGKYVAVIHPSVAYDLRQSKEWIEAQVRCDDRDVQRRDRRAARRAVHRIDEPEDLERQHMPGQDGGCERQPGGLLQRVRDAGHGQGRLCDDRPGRRQHGDDREDEGRGGRPAEPVQHRRL